MRVCDITGETMTEGFCIRDGEMYIKYEEHLVEHLKENGEFKDINDAYESGYYYYTEWES